MGPAEFATIFSSLKTAGEIAKAMKDIRDATVFQTKALELTGEIIAAQQHTLAAQMAQEELLRKVRQLEEVNARLNTWATEKERYELTDNGGGTFTRSLKRDMANGDPPHRICVQCYEQGRKGVLQSRGLFGGREKVQCMLCDKEVMLGADRSLPSMYATRR